MKRSTLFRLPPVPVALFVLMLLLHPVGLHAQTGGDRPDAEAIQEQMAARFDSLATHLNLTDAQAEQVKPILRQSLQERRARLASFRDEAEDKGRRGKRRALRSLRNDMKEIDEETIDQLDDILSEEQMDAYIGYRDAQREKMRDELRSRRNG